MQLKTVAESYIIAKSPDVYHGWPSVARTDDGELIVVYSGGRRRHIDPFGRTMLVRSTDDGATWSEPEEVNNSPIDDRDAGILVLRDGTWLVSWFTSLIFKDREAWCRKLYGDKEVDSWKPWIDGATPQIIAQYHGTWTRRSTDRGQTWEPAVSAVACSPHGPLELQDGRLLYVGASVAECQTIGVAASSDGGRTWSLSSEITIPEDTQRSWYHEPHAVETAKRNIVCLFRFEIPKQHRDGLPWKHDYMMQTESKDGGLTWSPLHQTPLHCHPPHLLKLDDNRLIVSYSGRYAPWGQRACLSVDHGKTWEIEDEIYIRDDAPNCDLGYPSSVQLSDGSIYTVYYQVEQSIFNQDPDSDRLAEEAGRAVPEQTDNQHAETKSGFHKRVESDPLEDKPCIMGTRWTLPS